MIKLINEKIFPDQYISNIDGKVYTIKWNDSRGKYYVQIPCVRKTLWSDDPEDLMDKIDIELKKCYKKESYKRLHEQDVEIEVKHEGILEVPEGKNVDDLPISHFEKLAKKKGLSKITRALNNLQVWNKNDNPKLSKWAGDMIDKLNKRMEKKESIRRLKEDSLDDIVKPEIEKRYIWPLYEDAKYEIVEIIKKYQNSMRYKDEILSFDFKDIDFRNWPALQLELTCSNEPYALIYDELERAGLFMDEDDEDFE